MTDNPFAPPRAAVDDAPPLPDARKPASVWLVQIAGALLACAAAWGGIEGLQGLAPGRPGSGFRVLVIVTVQGLLTALFVAMIVGAQRRRRYGRLGGLVMLGFILLCSGWNCLLRAQGLGQAASFQASEKVGELVGAGTVLLLVGVWFRAFGYGPRAAAWFGTRRAAPARIEPT